jgi:hypothetical protein
VTCYNTADHQCEPLEDGDPGTELLEIEGGGGGSPTPTANPDPCKATVVTYLEPGQTYEGLQCPSSQFVKRCAVLKNGDKLTLSLSAFNFLNPSARNENIKENIKLNFLTTGYSTYGVLGLLAGRAINETIDGAYDILTMPFHLDEHGSLSSTDQFRFMFAVAALGASFYGGSGSSKGAAYIKELAEKIAADPIRARKFLTAIAQETGEIWSGADDACAAMACKNAIESMLLGLEPVMRNIQAMYGDKIMLAHAIAEIRYKGKLIGLFDNADFIQGGVTGEYFANEIFLSKYAPAIRDVAWKEERLALPADLKSQLTIATQSYNKLADWIADQYKYNPYFLKNLRNMGALFPFLAQPGVCK